MTKMNLKFVSEVLIAEYMELTDTISDRTASNNMTEKEPLERLIGS
jgi:hypothetical protein